MLQPQIQRQLSLYNKLVFAAIADQEILQDVHVTTLKGEFAKNIEIAAVDAVVNANKQLTNNSVMAEMVKLFDKHNAGVQEQVCCSEDGISVVVNADFIDDAAYVRVFDLVQSALYELDGRFGTVTFGKPVSFKRSEIPWLNHH
jgi:hypothetical protein